MKKFATLVLFLCFTLASAQDYSAPEIYPAPQSADISATEYYTLKKIVIGCCEKKDVKEWATDHLKEWYGKNAPLIKLERYRKVPESEEGYTLDIDNKEVRICAYGIKGVRYALFSLRQLAIAKRGTMKVEGWIVPKACISDYPSLGFRGLHICWLPGMESCEIERMIRMAAYYKLNYVVIESRGTFRSNVAPWLGLADAPMTKEEIARLRGIASDCGVTLIPQMDVLAHASYFQKHSDKHCALDWNPEYQPLFEPDGGWNWCLSNPNVLKLQTQLIAEMLEYFGNPPYFHIGCEEAAAPSCPACIGQDHTLAVLRHITSISNCLASMDVKAMMWHDMLLSRSDPRWAGFAAKGSAKMAASATAFPKEIIICDRYCDNPREKYPTLDYFQSLGFNVLTCPGDNSEGIWAQGNYVRNHEMYGILGTNLSYENDRELVFTYVQLAETAWNSNPRNLERTSQVEQKAITHLRQVGWDMLP